MKWLSFTQVTQRNPTSNCTTLKEIHVEIIMEMNGEEEQGTVDCYGEDKREVEVWTNTTSVNVNTEGNTFNTDW
jgi:hypothetical protein